MRPLLRAYLPLLGELCVATLVALSLCALLLILSTWE